MHTLKTSRIICSHEKKVQYSLLNDVLKHRETIIPGEYPQIANLQKHLKERNFKREQIAMVDLVNIQVVRDYFCKVYFGSLLDIKINKIVKYGVQEYLPNVVKFGEKLLFPIYLQSGSYVLKNAIISIGECINISGMKESRWELSSIE